MTYRIGGEMDYKIGENAEIVGGKPQVCLNYSLISISLYIFYIFILF
jgi:hypothetical protein